MSKLSVHYDVYRKFIMENPSSRVSKTQFGFDKLELKGYKMLIDMDGENIKYFEFDKAIMMPDATKLQVAQMQADKKKKCFSVKSENLNIHSFVSMSYEYNNWLG